MTVFSSPFPAPPRPRSGGGFALGLAALLLAPSALAARDACDACDGLRQPWRKDDCPPLYDERKNASGCDGAAAALALPAYLDWHSRPYAGDAWEEEAPDREERRRRQAGLMPRLAPSVARPPATSAVSSGPERAIDPGPERAEAPDDAPADGDPLPEPDPDDAGAGFEILSVEDDADAVPADAAMNADDGLEAAAGWSVAEWEDTGPLTLDLVDAARFLEKRPAAPAEGAARAPFVNAQRRLRSVAGARAPAKAAIEITVPAAPGAAWPAAARRSVLAASRRRGGLGALTMRAANAGAEAVNLAVAVEFVEGLQTGYYESLPRTVPAGADMTITFDATAPTWKADATRWENTARVPTGRIGKLTLLLYAAPGATGRPVDLFVDQFLLAPPAPADQP